MSSVDSAESLATRDSPQSLDRILEAAEIEFAEKGFDGAGMKAIAARAELSQALLHYHFGTKDRLYAEVIRARSRKINAHRIALLDRIDTAAPDALARIVEALFRPPMGPDGGGKAYARIFTGLIVGRDRDRELVQECYDPTARRFIDALMQAEPRLNRASAAAVYQMALGVLASVIARDGRAERLAGTAAAPESEILQTAVRFVVGGARALMDD